MKSLFLKIFLWFWLTFLMIGATLSAVTTFIHPDDTLLARLSVRLPLEAKAAVDIYEREGKTGLKHYLDGLAERPSIEPYFFDQEGREVLGRTPPVQAAEYIKAMGIEVPRVSVALGWHEFVVQQLAGASGQRYTVLVVVTGPPIADLLTTPKILFILLAQLFVGTAFCYWLARHMATPVVQLSEAAGQIADGSLDARSGSNVRQRHDEIGRLGLSFDRMAERIESLVRGQQRLFGDVSHELRSPLTRLSVAEGLLRQCPPEEQEEYLDRIALEVEQLNELIGQLLTLSRIDGGIDTTHRERVELSSLIEEVAANGNFEAQTKHCAVTVDFIDACTTTGSREQLRRAIENVVRNAICYTQPNTDVEVTVRREYTAALSKVVIQVRDHGPGVSSEHLEKIFKPFYRIPASNGEITGGAGLGLAITDRIVRMYGGGASARNASDGGLIVKLELLLVE